MKAQIDTHWVENPGDLDRELAVIRRNRSGEVLVAASAVTYIHRKVIADFALDMRLPSVHQFREAVIDGALLSFGPSLKEVADRGAAYPVKILKGTKPGDLPVEQPRKYEVLLNLKTTKALGLTILPSLLARAGATDSRERNRPDGTWGRPLSVREGADDCSNRKSWLK